MNKKKVITVLLLFVMLVSSLLPILPVNATTDGTVRFNSSLYKALKEEFEQKGIEVVYNDAQYTMKLSEEAIASVTTLNLSNSQISDLTGLETFKNVTSIDLSANELTKDSNLAVLNSFNLTYLDLSSNEISDVSAVANIKNIETVNLHNQKFTDATVISNSIVDNGQYVYDVELPQIITDFAKPLKSEFIESTIQKRNGTGKLAVKWSAFNSEESKYVPVVVGTEGQPYAGLVELKIKITDTTNLLYNSEIYLYYVVINKDERGVVFKDENLYKAIKAQLTRKQGINDELKIYTGDDTNLYEVAYDEQLILVIKENDIINKITSLIVENKKVEDLTGIEAFVGLETGLDVHSNYIDTIDRVIELQDKKEIEEKELQTRYSAKVAELAKKIEERNALISEAEALKETLKKIEDKPENAEATQNAQKRLVEILGGSISDYPARTDFTLNFNNSTGAIAKLNNMILEKYKTLNKIYSHTYKLTGIITVELKNMTQEEWDSLTIESAKGLLEKQIEKLKKIKETLNQVEKQKIENYLGSLDELDVMKEKLNEDPNIKNYKEKLKFFKYLDYYVCYMNNSVDEISTDEIYEKQLEYFNEDGETLNYELCSNAKTDATIQNLDADYKLNLALRLGQLTEAEISALVTLPDLRALNMSENLIENIDDISKLVDLRKAYFGDNEISDISKINWAELKWLYDLDISFNNISDIKSLEAIKKLKSLDASDNLIGGSFNYTIQNIDKLEKFNLSGNQIDNIEYLQTQVEYIAKEKNQTVNEYIANLNGKINFKEQDLNMIVKVDNIESSMKFELPLIFRQLEEIEWAKTSFGINSFYGNVTSDGKQVNINAKVLGTETARVSVLGNGIGNGTVCKIKIELDKPVEDLDNNTNDNTNNDIGDNTQNTPVEKVELSVNTEKGSTVEKVVEKGGVSFVLVQPGTTVDEVLKDITLTSGENKIEIKDEKATNAIEGKETLKTNEMLVVEGLEDEIKCVITVKGDANADGKIDFWDIARLNSYIIGNPILTQAELIAGDVLGDSTIDFWDISRLNAYRIGNISTL